MLISTIDYTTTTPGLGSYHRTRTSVVLTVLTGFIGNCHSFGAPFSFSSFHRPTMAAAATPVSTSKTTTRRSATKSNDPHKFLEEVLSDESLSWVRERNAECEAMFGNPQETEDYRRILGILDSPDKIPHVAQIGDGAYYNFWQDEQHVQGIWRKTASLDNFDDPEWHTVLDLDALEDKPPMGDTWVWHGSTLLDEGPGHTPDRALIALSPGGSDADVTREFDLATETFVTSAEGGFELLTPAKSNVAYRSRDEVLVGTDFGPGSSTDSGYPRVIKSWKRGTPLSEAVTVFEAETTDVAGGQYAYHDRDGICHEFQYRAVTFYTTKYWYRSLTMEQLRDHTADDEKANPPFVAVPIPDDAGISTFGKEAMITLRTDWTPPGSDTTYAAGALLTTPMANVMVGDWSQVTCLFQPTPTTSLQSTTTTKDYVVLSLLQDVRNTLVVWKYDSQAGQWTEQPSPTDAVLVGQSIDFGNVNRDSAKDNRLFLSRDGYLTPDTLELADASDLNAPTTTLKTKPPMFQADNLTVNQYFCTSQDGTRIPYFIIHRENMLYDSNNPTLVEAYGGFEVSLLPSYAAGVGAAWLEAGGVKVVANIRGGGEYGPAWHQAALKEKRYKCYEDLEAVAQDLIERKITSPAKLAAMGGSNGGLLVGNVLTRPLASSLFGAVVCQVPLLDMKSYSNLLAGASWMAEYGNPDKDEDWTYLRRHSPYHLLRHDNLGLPEDDTHTTTTTVVNPEWVCPKVLFTTSTRDDRVHPGHARKMVRALLEEAQPQNKAPQVHYWENTEGGHGGAADNQQRAHMWALTYTMLKQTLGL